MVQASLGWPISWEGHVKRSVGFSANKYKVARIQRKWYNESKEKADFPGSGPAPSDGQNHHLAPGNDRIALNIIRKLMGYMPHYSS